VSRAIPASLAGASWRAFTLLPIVAGTVALLLVATAPPADRAMLFGAAIVAAVAGLSATSVGVFGAVLVPGLLLLGVPPAVAAPLSLLVQVVVIPLGATSHAAVGHVRRAITVPLIVGGVIGSVGGALLASSVPAAIVARSVSLVIVVVGLIVLASVRNGYGSAPVAGEQVHPGKIGAIGTAAGFASGISGAGWGPIGVKLLILTGIEPRHAIGSSLVGRIAMAVAAVATYAIVAAGKGGLHVDPRLFGVILAGSACSMVPGTLVIARVGRRRAAIGVATLSIALALPTLLALP